MTGANGVGMAAGIGEGAPALPARPRILVVTLRRIGDVLLTTPLIRSLRRAWPDATIDVLVFAGTAGILAGNPDINRVISMPARPTVAQGLALMARIARRYDLALSTQSGDRPTYFAAIAGRTHAGITGARTLSDRIKARLLHRTVAADERIHRVEQTLRLADALGIARVPELVPPAAGAISFTPPRDYAVIHAAPMFRYKEWTRAGWRALAAGLAERGIATVAIGGPGAEERAYLADIWQGVTEVHGAGWAETVALLNGARLYVGPDTSVTHLAAATGCRTIALFGPMDPRVWGPWPVGGLAEPWQAAATIQNRGNVWIVQNPLPCLPCTFEGCERHIESVSICLEELNAAQVLAAVDRALA
jgi:heptosyltransferase-3